jgi:hypothetical protein
VEFLFFIATDPEAEPYSETDGLTIDEWIDEMTRRRVSIAGDRLRPRDHARTVRVRGEHAIVTDGPFTESKEWIAGYDIIECADLDEAIEIASKHPMARFGRIEVRRAWPLGAPDE